MEYSTHETKNCTTWSIHKKDLNGCGVSCNCPRMKKEYDHVRCIEGIYNLWINDKLYVSEIDAHAWKYMNTYASIYQGRKREKEKMKRELDEILGRNK